MDVLLQSMRNGKRMNACNICDETKVYDECNVRLRTLSAIETKRELYLLLSIYLCIESIGPI